MKLNERQRKFAEEYVRLGNVYKSAINAGYSEPYAKGRSYELLENVGVKAFIDERLELLKKESIAEQDEVLQLYSSILRGEEREEVVISTMKGAEVITKGPDIKDRKQAGDELMKLYVAGNNQDLKNKLLEAQIKKILAETKNEESGVTKISIVDKWVDDVD